MAQSCTAADLLAASKCLCGIPSGQRELVMIYLLQQLAGLGNLTAAQLLDRAKCLCGLSERDMKAIEVALLCTATGGVPPCPPCPPSGGCTYQDMQVAWTPTSAKLGESISFNSFGSNSSITSITNSATILPEGLDWESDTVLQELNFPLCTSISVITLHTDSALATVTFPLLQIVTIEVAIGGLPITQLDFPSLVTVSGQFGISGNSGLTTINLPVFVPTNGNTIDFHGNNLSAATVNQVLARCVANAGFVSGLVDLSGPTNAAPTGQGIIDKGTLNARQVGLAVTN